MRIWVQSLASLGGLRIRGCRGCGVGLAVALIQHPFWELPYEAGTALKSERKKEERKKKKKAGQELSQCSERAWERGVLPDFLLSSPQQSPRAVGLKLESVPESSDCWQAHPQVSG